VILNAQNPKRRPFQLPRLLTVFLIEVFEKKVPYKKFHVGIGEGVIKVKELTLKD
jgi:hypothetical protein